MLDHDNGQFIFLFPLPCHDSLGQSQDLDLPIYISGISPFA